MKKLIIVLMVVAVASFLFVGCLPDTVTPVTPVTPTEPTEPTVKTSIPFITNIGSGNAAISLSSTATQYTNSPTVVGVGVSGAIIKVYIDGVQSGVGSSGQTGAIASIGVSMVTLTEGVKKLYITATQPGLAESDKSTEYTFTYDTTAPSIVSVLADSGANSVTVTFDGAVEMAISGTRFTESAMNPLNWFWAGNSGTSTQLTATNAIFAEMSSKSIRITPTDVVPTATASYYITCVADRFVATAGGDSVTDKAGNNITVAEVWAGLAVP